jgi:hypothetical protein
LRVDGPYQQHFQSSILKQWYQVTMAGHGKLSMCQLRFLQDLLCVGRGNEWLNMQYYLSVQWAEIDPKDAW